MGLELRNYMKTAHPGIEISKPGYLKQCMKLNQLAFYELCRHHNRNFYAGPGFSAFHGYLVLAADGSGINIPTTKETLEGLGHIALRMVKVPLFTLASMLLMYFCYSGEKKVQESGKLIFSVRNPVVEKYRLQMVLFWILTEGCTVSVL